MKVLLTGAFGNIGTSALTELLAQGHDVRCFDVRTPANVKAARRVEGKAEVVWGDLRRPEDVNAAAVDRDVVVHLAFIIPKLSVTGTGTEDRPDWSREINVGGTRNLLAAIQAQPKPPKLIFSSTLHVYGLTQDQPPVRTAADPVVVTDHYTAHKIECERMIRASGLDWCILRLGAVLPIAIKLDPGMFDVPLSNRIEFVHTRDVGLAIANAVSSDAIWGRVLLIGGGEKCQLLYHQIAERVLNVAGVGMLPAEAFSKTPFATDWLDTVESQNLLKYQHRCFDDWVHDMSALMGDWRRNLIRTFRPIVRRYLLGKSPYYRAANA
jgi:nucleoside-diphosphate-sugar epimerase